MRHSHACQFSDVVNTERMRQTLMLGAIIGDIVGSVYEWNNIKTTVFPLYDEKCFFTDDTVMTIAVAEALLSGGTADKLIETMKKYGRLYPGYGYGVHFNSWLTSNDREPYNSFGNGSAMRVAPCAWFATSLDEAEALAEWSASVTHNHPEGIKGARATAAAIYLARDGMQKDGIREYVQNNYGYDLSRSLDEIRPVYRFNETCQETVPEAIIAFLESRDFEGAIRNAISLGGDSDTLAAITGSIAGAFYKSLESDALYYGFGTPHIAAKAMRFLDDTMATVINAWLDAGKPLDGVVKKGDWETHEFSKPQTINVAITLTEAQYVRIRMGLRPFTMEDKWFAYFVDGSICFHRSWTGAKIYEATIQKDDSGHVINAITVERDPEIYSQTDDVEDIHSFNFLVARGLLGLGVMAPITSADFMDALKGWGSFGQMIL